MTVEVIKTFALRMGVDALISHLELEDVDILRAIIFLWRRDHNQ